MEGKVKAASENKSKIESAISNINNYLLTIKQQLSDSNSRILQNQNQRQTLLNQRNQTLLNIVQVNQTIQTISVQIQTAVSSLGTNSKSC
jgi:chromosome segregation ATPase